jgi:O-methyltransferase
VILDDIGADRNRYKEYGYAILRYDDGPIHSYPYDAPWMADIHFSDIYNKIRHNTLVDRLRCYDHYELVQQSNKIEGDVLEIGVWRGGTAGLLTTLAPKKTVFLADTFRGVVKSSDWEHYEDGAHADASEEAVATFLDRGLGVSNFKILKGVFPEDTGHLIRDRKFAYVHIDVDVYVSAKDAFSFAWDRMVSGGICVFDDYGFITACSGVHKFVNEIKHDIDKIFVHNSNGHGIVIKR